MYRFIMRGGDPCRANLQRTIQRISRKFNNTSGGRRLPPIVRDAALMKLVVILSPLVIVGSTVTYAKYDKEFRHMLEKNIPGVESLLKVLLAQEKAFMGISKQFDEFSKSLGNVKTKVVGLFGFAPSSRTLKLKANQEAAAADGNKETTAVAVRNTIELKPLTTNQKSVEFKPPQIPLPSTILELEKAVEVAASLALKEYKKATDILKSFNADVCHVVDQAVERVNPSHWSALKNKSIARDFSVEAAEKLAKEAMVMIVQCEDALTKATTAENHEQVIVVRAKVKKLVDKINKVRKELDRCKDLASASEKYWRSVKKARNYFIEEIESIFPGLNLAEKQLQLSKEDLDLFITHAYSHVLAYQKELIRLQTDGEQRLQRVIATIKENGSGSEVALQSQVDFLLEAEKRKIAIENQKKIVQIRAESERVLREQLKKQAEAHINYITEAIAFKEAELKRDFNRELDEKLAKEKENFQLELAALVGKMRGMHKALQVRATSERSGHQSQALWAACQALWALVRNGEQGLINSKKNFRPLKSEINAIAKVAAGDELVEVIIKSLPREVEERGIYPEGSLRDRFLNVDRIARKVALVSDDGGSLPSFFFSYLTSLFVAKPEVVFAEDELEDTNFDFSKLDTFDILNRARYFVERGDLLNALRYMNLLKGAPRIVARDWLKETRLLLETQMAANTLMAHAAASGSLYL